MQAGTNKWQRVDNTGCFPWALRAFLLSWAIMLPYAVITGSKGWFGWSLMCVLTGVWWTLRERSQRSVVAPEMTVGVVPSVLYPDERCLVTLRIEGDKARTVRWWSAELMIAQTGDEPKVLVSAEFAIDPEAGSAPVSELQMVLVAPGAAALGDTAGNECFVQATVQTDRGRMESGRVPVELIVGRA